MSVIIPLIIIVGIGAWYLRPRGGMRSSGYGSTLAVIALAIVLTITAVIFQLQHNAEGTIEVSTMSNNIFIVSLGLVVVGVLVAVSLAIMHKNLIARGIGFGVCVAIVILVIQLALLEWLGGV